MVKYMIKIIVPKFNKLKEHDVKMELVAMEKNGKKEIFQIFTFDDTKQK